MILPKIRDPRFVTIRRGGTLSDSDHHLLVLWAASCAEHVLDLFESARPGDLRPRQAIEGARGWVRGEVRMMEARAMGGPRLAWGSTPCRVCRWSGRGSGTCRCPRTWRGRLCNQGCTCCSPCSWGRRRRTT